VDDGYVSVVAILAIDSHRPVKNIPAVVCRDMLGKWDVVSRDWLPVRLGSASQVVRTRQASHRRLRGE